MVGGRPEVGCGAVYLELALIKLTVVSCSVSCLFALFGVGRDVNRILAVIWHDGSGPNVKFGYGWCYRSRFRLLQIAGGAEDGPG